MRLCLLPYLVSWEAENLDAYPGKTFLFLEGWRETIWYERLFALYVWTLYLEMHELNIASMNNSNALFSSLISSTTKDVMDTFSNYMMENQEIKVPQVATPGGRVMMAVWYAGRWQELTDEEFGGSYS